jgi:hypothetical protein
MSCTSRAPSPATPPLPSTPGGVDPSPSLANYLRFTPGTYRYRVAQTARIQAEGSVDTVPSVVTTEAILLISVWSDSDSTFDITVSIDSINIATQGSIPRRSAGQVTRLDSIVHVAFTPTSVITQVHLPDSLCTYGGFIGIAREVLVPELPLWIEGPSKRTYTDTATVTSCRAGAKLESLTTREVHDLGRDPPEFSIKGRTVLRGMGLLRRDSIVIGGSTSTRGSLIFEQGNRLPSILQSESEGMITITLGASRTVFRQTSTQAIHLEPSNRPH